MGIGAGVELLARLSRVSEVEPVVRTAYEAVGGRSIESE